MKTLEKIGKITIEHNSTEQQKYNGAKDLRALVRWMDSRDERLNQNKSKLQLIREFNKVQK